jgi:hypothetical protein
MTIALGDTSTPATQTFWSLVFRRLTVAHPSRWPSDYEWHSSGMNAWLKDQVDTAERMDGRGQSHTLLGMFGRSVNAEMWDQDNVESDILLGFVKIEAHSESSSHAGFRLYQPCLIPQLASHSELASTLKEEAENGIKCSEGRNVNQHVVHNWRYTGEHSTDRRALVQQDPPSVSTMHILTYIRPHNGTSASAMPESVQRRR